MKRFIPIIIILVLLLTTGTALASVITGALWHGIIVAQNEDAAATHISANFSPNTQSLMDAGFLNASATNSAVQNTSGADTAYMPGYNAVNSTMPWMFWIDSIGKNAQRSYVLYMGGPDMDGKIRYFPADGGMLTYDSDNASLELGDDFIYQIKGWFNTDNGTDKYLYHKESAFKTYISPTIDEQITASIYGEDDNLDFVAANNDSVMVTNHADFSFTAGGGVDTACSMSAWILADDINDVQILAKYNGAGGEEEWSFALDLNDKLRLRLYDTGAATWIGRCFDFTPYQSMWTHVAATYDASETSAGITLYINGVEVASTDSSTLPYVGMTAAAEDLYIGSWFIGNANWFDGGIAEVKLWKGRELTLAEVIEDYVGVETDTTNMVGWWKLDDGAGLPQDSSGLAHHAAANTADWVNNFDYRVALSVTATGVSSGEHTVEVGIVRR